MSAVKSKGKGAQAAINEARKIAFLDALQKEGIPAPEQEYRFHDERRWRFDFAWPSMMVALEWEGGAYTQGRHTRGKGFLEDAYKYSEAAVQGWCVIRCQPSDARSPQTLELIKRALARPLPPPPT